MPDRGAQWGSEQQESVDMGCGSHEGSNTEATHSKCCRRTRPSKVNTYASMVFRVIECCTYHYQSSNSGMASKEKIVAFGRPADSKDLGFIGDHVSRQRKGLLRPTVRLDSGLFSRESVASVIHVRRPCRASRSGYVAMSQCHAARAVAARLKSIVRFGALAG